MHIQDTLDQIRFRRSHFRKSIRAEQHIWFNSGRPFSCERTYGAKQSRSKCTKCYDTNILSFEYQAGQLRKQYYVANKRRNSVSAVDRLDTRIASMHFITRVPPRISGTRRRRRGEAAVGERVSKVSTKLYVIGMVKMIEHRGYRSMSNYTFTNIPPRRRPPPFAAGGFPKCGAVPG